MMTSAPILALYDPNKDTKVNADALSNGIGCIVMQKQEDGIWKPTSYVSRALSPVECRYSQVERECLAFVWTCERSSNFIWGRSIIGETDQLTPCIQRMRMRPMRFDIKQMVHVPGKQMYTRDTLSRLIARQHYKQPEQSLIPDDDMTAFIGSIIDRLPVSDVKLKQIIEVQDDDEICKRIKQYCLEQWPDKHQLPSILKPYWNERGELSVNQNVILKSSRILIPSSVRLEVLDKIHQGHQGITKCRERAKKAVWWPGLSRQIQDMIMQYQ